MHKELDNVIVESNISIDYFDEIINYIKNNEKEILNFFSLSGLKEKYQVKILDYKSFKEFELANMLALKIMLEEILMLIREPLELWT